MNAEVYVNGQKAGGHPYGYSSFFVDITPYAKIGQNEIEVRVDNSQRRKQTNSLHFDQLKFEPLGLRLHLALILVSFDKCNNHFS